MNDAVPRLSRAKAPGAQPNRRRKAVLKALADSQPIVSARRSTRCRCGLARPGPKPSASAADIRSARSPGRRRSARLRTIRFAPIWTRQARLLEVNSLLRLGDATYYAEDVPGSLALYRQAEALVTQELARRDSIVWIDRLGDVKFNVSGSLGDMPGHEREALAEARAGVAEMQRVLAYGPDANIEKRLLVLYGQEATMLSQLGDVGEAVQVSNRSIALREARLARQPLDPQRSRDLAIALTSGVEFLARAARPDEACRLAQRAAAQWQAIAARGNLGERDARRNKPAAEGAVRQYCH